MGIVGAYHSQDLGEIKLMYVKEINDIIIVNIPDTKNEMSRTFTMTASEGSKINVSTYFQLVKKIKISG